MRFKEFEP